MRTRQKVVQSGALTCMLSCLALFLACNPQDRDKGRETQDALRSAEEKNKTPAIIFLGDSLSAGHGLAPEENPPALIQKKIKEAGLQYKVINGGRSGDTTAGGLSRIAWYLRSDAHIKHVIIWLGANDSMRGLDLNKVQTNLRDIVKKIRSFDSQISIYLMQMYTFPNIGAAYAKQYAQIFTKVAQLEKIVLLPFPLVGVAAKQEYNQSDGIHPNALGAAKAAENIWASLKNYL